MLVLLLLILLYAVFKKIKSITKQIPSYPKDKSLTPKDIVNTISKLKDSELSVKENYHLLSDNLKKWILVSLDINAPTKSTSDIFKLMGIEDNKPNLGKAKGRCLECFYSPYCTDSKMGEICSDFSIDHTMEKQHKKKRSENGK